MTKKIRIRFLLCLFALGLNNCSVSENQSPTKDTLQFIIIGDWGTPGSSGQELVAKQMNALAADTSIDFIVTTGDNFYMKGVQSVDDPLWQSTFENIYSLPALKNIPWYVSLGNHDHMGDIYAQMKYGEEHKNWILPEAYYSKDFTLGKNSSVRILFLDTSPFVEEYRATPDYYPNLLKQNTKAQIKWIDTMLNKSTNTWRIVIGHHPVYSAGAHGDTEELKNVLPQLFERKKVHAYFAGHDHHLEHYQLVGTTHHFISGGGSQVRGVSERKHRQFAASSLGFAHVVLNKNCMQVSFINEKGNKIYQTKIAVDNGEQCQ